MSFLLNDGVKVTEAPFNQLFPEIGRLADAKDIDSLMAVRRKIHEEFLELAGEDELKRRRLEGIQWTIDAHYYQTLKETEGRLSYVQAHMWDGAEVVRGPDGPGLGSF